MVLYSNNFSKLANRILVPIFIACLCIIIFILIISLHCIAIVYTQRVVSETPFFPEL